MKGWPRILYSKQEICSFMFQPSCFLGGQDSPSFGWSRFGTWGRVYSWDFLLIPLVLLQLVQNSKIWAYQNKISVFKDASYKNSKYIQSDLISTINYSWAKWESRSQKYEKCLRPRHFQSIQYKMKVHRLNIFSLKYKVLNQEIPQNQDFLCVCVCVCVHAHTCVSVERGRVYRQDLVILGLRSLNEGSLYVQHALDSLPVPTGPILCF